MPFPGETWNRAWGQLNSRHMLLFELFHAAAATLVLSAFELGAIRRIKAMNLNLQHTLARGKSRGEEQALNESSCG